MKDDVSNGGDGSDFFAGIEPSPYAEDVPAPVAGDGNSLSVDFPDRKRMKGGEDIILSTRANLKALIDAAEIDVRFDVYTRDIVAWRNRVEIKSHVDALLIDLAVQSGLPKSAVLEQLDALALDRPLNKPVQWLEKRKKPKGDPLGEWLIENDLVITDEERFPIGEQWAYIVWSKFFIAACAAADQLERCKIKEAENKYEQVMVLVSGQGMKKSTAVRQLLPPALRPYFGDGVNLNLNSKDSIVEATSNWIAELGEIDATFRKSDIAALKAFLSRTVDVVRLPYDRRAQRVPRRTVFFASVNDPQFLQDTTGNRRYLPVNIHKPLVYSEGIGERIFAQAWHRYLGGAQWWLTDAETIRAKLRQEEHDGNSLTPLLEEAFDFESDMRSFKIKPGIILRVLGFQGNAVAQNTKKLAASLQSLGIEKYGDTRREKRYYFMPPMSPEYLLIHRRLTEDHEDKRG